MIVRKNYLPTPADYYANDIFLVQAAYPGEDGQEIVVGVHKTLEGAIADFMGGLERFPKFKDLNEKEKSLVIENLDYYDNSNGDTLYVSGVPLEE